MPLSNLPKVLLQLVMHSLEQSSLLRFARCCRFTLNAASDPFAFHLLPPIQICSVQRDLPTLLDRSLCRFSRKLAVRWCTLPTSPRVDGDMRGILGLPHLYSLDALGLANCPWSRHLAYRAFRSLHVLAIDVAPALAADWSILPTLKLHTMHLRGQSQDSILAILPQLHSLTDLTLEFPSHIKLSEEYARCIGACAGLRQLSMPFVASNLMELILPSTLIALTDVVLDASSLFEDVAALWIVGSAAPPNLVRLTFLHCYPVRNIIKMMCALPGQCKLRQLTLQIHPHLANDAAALMPSVAEFQTLLERMPQTLFRLELWAVGGSPPQPSDHPGALRKVGSFARVRGRDFRMPWYDTHIERIKDVRLRCERIVAIDPGRVNIYMPPLLSTREEQDGLLRERFQRESASALEKATDAVKATVKDACVLC